jgi:hypothetical protein
LEREGETERERRGESPQNNEIIYPQTLARIVAKSPHEPIGEEDLSRKAGSASRTIPKLLVCLNKTYTFATTFKIWQKNL